MDLSALIAKTAASAPMPYTEVRQEDRRVIAHVDGDYMAYFAAGNDGCSAGEARRNVLSRISKLKSVSGAGRVVMHLTHGASTKGDRFLVATTQPYQGQRSSGRKPRNWQFLREWMETYDEGAFEPKIWLTREADDGIAHVCDKVARHRNLLHVVHTADKDMRMFAGFHVSWNEFKLTEVPLDAYDIIGKDGKQYGHKWFWHQLLTGDSADHIPGLPGIGPATADSLLAKTTCNEDAAPVVYGEYSRARGEEWQDYFAEQAVLLWMRTDLHADLLDVLKLQVFGPKLIAAFERLRQAVSVKRNALARIMHEAQSN